MPFTPAHPLAVLPLVRTPLPMSALVVGSVVPDLPLYLGSFAGYEITHGWLGILVIDVLLGIALLAGWFLVLRDPLVDLAPGPVRDRLEPSARLPRRTWGLVPPAIMIGSATHVAWDELTHPDRWGTRNVAWLAEQHGPFIGASWFQYASGSLGTLAVVAVALTVLLRLPARPRERRVLPAPSLGIAIVAALVVGLAGFLSRRDAGIHAMLFRGVVDAMVAAAVALAVLAVVWWGRRTLTRA